MSDEGDKTCPLCAEEMDLTDQQLKPCKCGYDICVWCWNHIMEMAEKDGTEGRCPACRVPYDKEKIERMAANCERLVAEVISEKKTKSQKAKTKSTEGRKELSTVRVIRHNLVYIVGLPLNLADEDLLQHREYFGQYGKVLKVSMSRTAAGVIQQFPNDTCSVYITYSKEQEAIRCIQSVHGYVLDGRPLKACFGTTKYCHAWLRNVTCTNPDCLYLHEVGSRYDSSTNEETISEYTRSRVQQITGPVNMQRRSGNLLPPPVDDYCQNNSASNARPIAKSPPNNTGASISKGSPPDGSSGRCIGLPAGASWGMRASNQPSAGLACSNGPSKQKTDSVGSTMAFSSAVADTTRVSSLHNHSDSTSMKSKTNLVKPLKQDACLVSRVTASEVRSAPAVASASEPLSSQTSYTPHLKHVTKVSSIPPSVPSSSPDSTFQSYTSTTGKEGNITMDGKIQKMSSDMSSLLINENATNEQHGLTRPSSSDSDNGLTTSSDSQVLEQFYSHRESLSSPANGRSVATANMATVTRDQHDWRTDSQTQFVSNSSSDLEEDILSFDNQRLKDPEINRSTHLLNSATSFRSANHSRSHSLQYNDPYNAVDSTLDNIYAGNNLGSNSLLHGTSMSSISNGYHDKFPSTSVASDVSGGKSSFLHSNEMKGNQMGRFFSNADSNTARDTGEDNIISNILSLDFDTWDEPLTSPQNLAKLLGDTEKPTLKISNSWKAQSNGQSRFSFARQEDSHYQPFDVEPSLGVFGQMGKTRSFSHDFAENRDSHFGNPGIPNGFSSHNTFEEPNSFAGSSAMHRVQKSAPPGFSIPSRAPPPGFSSHERVDRSHECLPGNHFQDSTFLRNSFQGPPSGNVATTGDIEFMDPAILAVGKGRFQGGLNNNGFDMRSNFPSQPSYENDARLQLLMQRSFNTQQNQRYADIGDGFSSRNESYGIPSRHMDQAHPNNLSSFAQLSLQQHTRNTQMSNGHWDGWNEVQGGNNMGMAELLRNERLGFNKYYAGYDDAKFRMQSSGDLYNRTFGM